MEKEFKVAALKNGTVIDHIPPERLFTVVSLLHLEEAENQITIGNNLDSAKLGRKGIIKISDRFFAENEINKIALVAPNAKINIIENYSVVQKFSLVLPKEISSIVQCMNPNCVTNHQAIATRFHVEEKAEKVVLRCHYCEQQVRREEVKINNNL